MKVIKAENPDLKSMLPKSYARLGTCTPADTSKTFASGLVDLEGDAFGRYVIG